jgi:hypothetical protein
VQLVAAPPSIAQVVVYGASPPETENVRLMLFVFSRPPFGGVLIATTGRPVLMVHA